MSYYNIKNNLEFKQRESNKELNNNLIIKDYINEIDSLKSHISNLKAEIKELQSQIRLLRERNIALNEYEHENISLNLEAKQLKETITNLEENIILTLRKGKEETREVTVKLENEINYYKRIFDTVKGKIEAAEHIIKLNQIQNNYILKLEQEINDMKTKNEEKIRKMKVEHDLHYKHLKNKIIDLIKKSNQDIRKENATNIEVYSKFSAINKMEMQEELEKQNKAIMNLIKENETKDKQILNLNQEKQAYHSVDKILKKQNLKFSQIIKNFNDKQNNKTNNSYNSNKNILFKATMVKEKSNCKYDDDLVKKYKILNKKLDDVLDRERTFQKKYYGIIKLYDTALKNLLNDEQLTTKKININLDKFIEGNIDTYTKEEKIQIICLLIKHLLPLIKIQNIEILKLRNLFNNIDIKIKINSGLSISYSRNKNSNIIKSLCDIRQYASDLDYTIKKEQKRKLKDKSIFNTYNNTYNNINHNNNINLLNSKEESKSLKSSVFGLNIDASFIKKKKGIKFDESSNDGNKFVLSAFNFYRTNNKSRSKNGEIKLYKKSLLRNELMNKNLPLQRFMFFSDINKKTSLIGKQNNNNNI